MLTQQVNETAIGATTRSKSGTPDRTHQLKITPGVVNLWQQYL
ncbi:MAG: hypothetical protein AB4352_27575 [Hormoscilla sp.]